MTQPGDPLTAKLRPPSPSGLHRERLLGRLNRGADYRLVLVVAPAGAGKTTLLAQFTHTLDVPVAWYRPEAGDSREADLLGHLEAALACAGVEVEGGWDSADAGVRALERCTAERILLAIDDLHVLLDSPAERALKRLVTYLPPAVTVLAASRAHPGFDLSRLRLSGALLEVDADDLRFRAWEVERLFRDVYGEPLPPEDLARLARRTEGWAAGLQLFHLATQGKPWTERRRTLEGLGRDSMLVREYLAHNVLDGIHPELRRFLVGTCVLTVLTGPLCDRLLERTGSHAVLEELHRRQIFTQAEDDGRRYRYHEVLRSHLEAALVAEVGEAETRARYLRAGRLLERGGFLHEALHAYSRGDCWDDVTRLLGQRGRRIAQQSGTWVDDLPQRLVTSDPWLTLAAARRHAAEGQWDSALSLYHRAEQAFGSTAGIERCRRERALLQAWLDPLPPTPLTDPSGVMRAATRKAPLRVAAAAPAGTTGELLAVAVAALLGGAAADAHRHATAVLEQPAVEPVLVAGARAVAGLAGLLSAAPHPHRNLSRAVETFEHLGFGWLARVVRAALACLDPGSLEEAAALRDERARAGDEWGAALVGLFEGFGRLAAGDPRPAPLDAAADHFRRLGATTLECWARAGRALAGTRLDLPGAAQAVASAESLCRSVEVRGPLLLTALARAVLEPDRVSDHLDVAEETAADLGIALGPLRAALTGAPQPSTVRSAVARPHSGDLLRCFGGFRLVLGGREPDLTAVRPRAVTTLHMLAMHVGRPLHRERIVDALWPDASLEAGIRNLQVAVSSLRRVLEPDAERGEWAHLVRRGEAYTLLLPEDADVDLLSFGGAWSRARAARAGGDRPALERALEALLLTYTGELLPETGPAEWVVPERRRYAAQAADAAGELARLRLAARDVRGAVGACEEGLRIDRYRGELWQVLAGAYEYAGDRAAAARVRQEHAEVLTELGLEPAAVTSAGGTRSR